MFEILKGLKQDGTFNQQAPLTLLMSLVPKGQVLYSFDLSAATDRLPIDVQSDILNVLSDGLGTLWRNLLNIPWSYGRATFSYAVGQPMGAYSSWGMLALTHHILVRVAAISVGVYDFQLYCILGDDVVIAHDQVAQAYRTLMTNLGVSINLSKSVISKDFAEFAKMFIGPVVGIMTPIGPGLILRSIRYRYYAASLLVEAYRLNIISSIEGLLALIRDVKVRVGPRHAVDSLWACFGLNSALLNMSQVAVEMTIS